MIKKAESISMSEAKSMIKEKKDLKSFIEKFTNISEKDSKKMRDELRELNLIKLREEHITKIIDLLPTQKEEINKIFMEINLNEDETKKIIEIVKQFK